MAEKTPGRSTTLEARMILEFMLGTFVGLMLSTLAVLVTIGGIIVVVGKERK
ncbi:MAG: hypothetical protein WBV59_18575 [Anaerolineae bacterium]